MIRLSRCAAAALLAACLILPAAAAEGSEAFLHHHVKAFKQAGETGKPLVIDFYTNWCVPCKEMERSPVRALKRPPT